MSGNVAVGEYHEGRFKDDFERFYGGYYLSHLGKLSPVDFLAYNREKQKISAVIEFKQRGHQHDRFNTVWLNLRKATALKLLSAGFNCRGFFYVMWNDNETRYMAVHQAMLCPIVPIHTDNRDWPTDKELGYDIPIQEMMPMKPKPNLKAV